MKVKCSTSEQMDTESIWGRRYILKEIGWKITYKDKEQNIHIQKIENIMGTLLMGTLMVMENTCIKMEKCILKIF